MHTFQITKPVLENYKNDRLSDARIDFLIKQANEQLEEIAQNKELYDRFLTKVNAPQKIDNILLWMLLMSNDVICTAYRKECNKKFRDMLPICDLADLMLYTVYLKQVKDVELDGLDYLLQYEHDGIEEMDQCAFSNVFLYIQQSKEMQMEF